jgi:hypothetical protein
MNISNIVAQQNGVIQSSKIMNDNIYDIINEKIDKLLNVYYDNSFIRLTNIDNKSLFLYLVILGIFYYATYYLKIRLTHVICIFCALIIIYIIYSKKQLDAVTSDEQSKIKLSLIRPPPQNLDNYPDLIEFLFTVRNFYYINPNAFTLIIAHLDDFIEIYEDIINKKILYCKQNYQVLVNSAREILNNLHSIIYNLDVDKILTKKYQISMKELNIILYQYIKTVIDKCDSINENETTNIYSSFIIDEMGPHGRNYFDPNTDNMYNFDIY